MAGRLASAWALGVLILATSPGPAQAQTAGGAIAGAVVDVDTRAPIAGALVTLQPEPAGLFPRAPGSSGFAATARNVMTDSAGAYRFADLVPGRYRIDALRPGYRPYSVVVELRGGAPSAVLLGLAVEPIPLPPVRSTARREDPFPRARATALTTPAPARLRPGAPLTTDAQELTRDDVLQAITTGEPDLFRALQRLPGMSARSDYSAELWTRGAPWHETRVFFDGVPIFDPLHGLGTISGLSPEAVGALWLYPGVHPVRLAEGAAGAVELRTRRGAGDGRLNAAADLSLLSAGASLDQRLGDGAADWTLSARRSSLDWLSRVVSDAANRPELRVPYGFWDVSGRADIRLGANRSLEASALRQGDSWRADPAGTQPSGDAAWGNVVARVSLVSASDRLESHQTLAFSSRYGQVRTPPAVEPAYLAVSFTPDAAPATTTELNYLALSGEWRTPAGPSTAWSFGYDAVRQQAWYAGEKAIAAPFLLAATSLPWEPDSMELTGPALRTLGGWMEGTFTPWQRLTLQPALRLDVGDAVLGGGSLRPAPRMTARLELSPRVALSAGAARTWQYAQSLAPAGVRQATLSSDDAWLVAGPTVPALRADIVTAGVEAWLGDWRVTANGFGRKEIGATIPDPRPGLAFAPRPVFVTATRYARGIELSGRRVAPRWSAYASYSWASSQLEAEGLVFPSGADQRHILDASTLVRLAPALRAGAALTAAGGTPYTPIVQEQIGSDLVARLGDPNSARGKAYASLDLLLDWSATLGGRDVGAWFQLENALGRDNGVTYVSSRPGCVLGWCGPRAILENSYQRGLPRLPVLGVRARF